jgi:YjbE family integral membrane protein
MDISTASLIAVGEIIWIDLLLSGDNAVVIALACRDLPDRQKKWGIVFGALAAVGLRIVFALIISQIMQIPFLMTFGGVMLLWIAIKLLKGEDESERRVPTTEKLWHAVRTIAMADAVMSLDNVVAISAASGGNYWLFVFGLLVSIPLVVMGASIVTRLVSEFPIFIWAGGALLGWIAGEMLAKDPGLHRLGLPHGDMLHYAFAAAGALLVLAAGYVLKPKRPGVEHRGWTATQSGEIEAKRIDGSGR